MAVKVKKIPIEYLQTMQKRKTTSGYSPSFVLAFLSMLFACLHEFTQNIFSEVFSSFNYTFTVVSIMAIIIYQLYILLSFRYYKYKYVLIIGLLGIAYFALLYLFLFSGLTRALYLCSMILNLLVYKRYKLSNSEKNKLYWLFILLVIIMIINGSVKGMVIDNKVNPNTSGLLLMLIFCMSIVRFRKSKKVLDFLIAVSSFGLQFLYQSRTATVGCVAFLTLVILFCGGRKYCTTYFAAFIILLISVISVVFAYWYAEILYQSVGRGNITIFGKDLFTGRQYIWNLAFESIRKNFWFGVGSDFNEDLAAIQNNSALLNAHNQSLGILTSFGVTTFVMFTLVFAYLTSRSCETTDKCKRKVTFRLPIVFIVSILIMNFAETNFFYSWGMVIMAAYCFICNNCEKIKKRRYLMLMERNAER
ncbi:MAG: O-antigen ligase family protein [Clostridiales bacterium]|nr:O-antigen ligase family protein [Clostridiales bacterium]